MNFVPQGIGNLHLGVIHTLGIRIFLGFERKTCPSETPMFTISLFRVALWPEDFPHRGALCAGCGASTTAGKNTNRTSMVSNGSTTTYAYDAADRLTSTKTRRRFHGRIGAAATHSTRPTDTPQRDVTSTNPQSSRSTALESRRGELG